MNQNREFTLRILNIVRDNPYYTNRMVAAWKHMAVEIAEVVVNKLTPPDYLIYAYNYFKERAYL